MFSLLLFDINIKIIVVSIYAQGSLLPLSNSNIDAIDPFKFNLWDLKIANTDAASVDPTIAPISKPSNNVVLNIKKHSNPVNPDVKITPNVDKRIDGFATDFAIFQLVPNPQKNIMNINAIIAILLVSW